MIESIIIELFLDLSVEHFSRNYGAALCCLFGTTGSKLVFLCFYRSLDHEPLRHGVTAVGTSDVWEFNGQPVPVDPLYVIEASFGATVNFVAFGDGDIAKCRLPHRLSKRRSKVTKDPYRVCIIAVAHSNGYIDVYNFDLLNDSSSHSESWTLKSNISYIGILTCLYCITGGLSYVSVSTEYLIAL